MANQDGIKIPICEDDMGEGFKELWRDYAETMRPLNGPFMSRLESREPKEDEPEKQWVPSKEEQIAAIKKQLDDLKKL